MSIIRFKLFLKFKILNMKILIVGGNGTIGRRIVEHLKPNHELIIIGRKSGDIKIDIAEEENVIKMFEQVGNFDALVNVSGDAKWDRFEALNSEDYYHGIKHKLMSQINLVRYGAKYISDKGSITLTTGILADHPVLMTSVAAMVNGGVHSFVKASSMELDRGIRLNVVSSGLVQDAAEKYANYFPGHKIISMPKVVQAYDSSIFGNETGQIIRVYE